MVTVIIATAVAKPVTGYNGNTTTTITGRSAAACIDCKGENLGP